MLRSRFSFFLFYLLLCIQSFSQRIEIDRLERDFEGSFRDREAFELSQKFIQIDSTYYTGYYFEGLYRYFRASDKLGYEKAIKPLKRAVALMETDFRRELTRSTDLYVYINTYQLQRKYAILIDLLEKSYQYVERPDLAIEAARKLIERNFVFNFGADPYATISWIYHRNRTYGPDRFDFLMPSIEENVRMASRFADSIKIVDRRNRRYVRQWFPEFANNPDGNYYHYKDIVYSYLLKIDSAEYCASQLKRLDYLSNNNYGNLQFIQSKFDNAEEYYNLARRQDNYFRKSTKEFDYMESVINIFKNDIPKAKALIDNSIGILGTTPGFGWNNIAMARLMYYAGDLENSKKYRDKAAQFKELHINSTWGKVQYDRNTLLFQYLYHKQKINEYQFLDKYYWLNPSYLGEIILHYFKKENALLLLTSELSANPERFLVLYNLFASENTIFFDEIWEVIKDFNPSYFIDVFEEKKRSDQREGVLKYYNYFIAQFHLEDDEPQKAIDLFQAILEDPTLNPQYEKLLLGRVYEGLANAFLMLEKEDESEFFVRKFYQNFPQLVPYSELSMKMNLNIRNTTLDKQEESVIEELKSCDIKWEEDGSQEWPSALLTFDQDENRKYVDYEVYGEGLETKEGRIYLASHENPGKVLAMRLFDIRLEPR